MQAFYVAMFGRPADPRGLTYFDEITNGGLDLSGVGFITGTEEYQLRFYNLSPDEVVNSIYQNLFNRQADAEGLSFFSEKLSGGELTLDLIAIAIMQAAEGDDAIILGHKVEAANLFTDRIDTGVELYAYAGELATDVGRNFLSDVGHDPSSIPTVEETDAAIAILTTTFAPPEYV